MNKPPAFQFYPKDFLMDDKVVVMNLEEKGAYIVLLSYCWNNNGLTKNQNELKNMCGNPENWECIWEKVGKCFYEKKGKFFNKRLEKELKKQKKWREKSRLGGIQSGISRSKKVEPKVKGDSEMVQTKDESKSNSSSSSSSSSTKEEEKNKDQIDKEFEDFWKFYRSIGDPKDDMGSKEKAKAAYETLRKRISKEEIVKAAHGESNYLKYKRLEENFNQRKKFVSTWLKSDQWKEHKDFEYKARL